ncbi:hypothetical protein HS125_02610 [bacterium]|nr:hypothetical protein [bacterium]
MPSHPFWLAVVVACLAWYSVLTVYVGIRGAADIRGMLRRLGEQARENSRKD